MEHILHNTHVLSAGDITKVNKIGNFLVRTFTSHIPNTYQTCHVSTARGSAVHTSSNLTPAELLLLHTARQGNSDR